MLIHLLSLQDAYQYDGAKPLEWTAGSAARNCRPGYHAECPDRIAELKTYPKQS